MKKENIVELNVGIYESVKLKVNRAIVLDILSKFPQLNKINEENKENEKENEVESINYSDLYDVSTYALYKMANALEKEFTYEKAQEIFDYASDVVAIVNNVKQPCDMVLMTNIIKLIKEVFTNTKGKEVQVVEFKMN